jgi:hypothetical protein
MDDNAGKAEFKCVDPCAPNSGNTTCTAMPFWQIQPGATCASFGKKPICPMTTDVACAPGSHFVEGPLGNDGCPTSKHCEKDTLALGDVDPPPVDPIPAIATFKLTAKPFCGGISTQCAQGFHEAWDNGKQPNGCPLPAKCVKN